MKYLIMALLVGCASPGKKMAKLETGMDRTQVKAVLGDPDETKAQGRTTYLVYVHEKCTNNFARIFLFGVCLDYARSDYFVRLLDGKVEAFGKVGDFDSTQAPTQKILVDKKLEVIDRGPAKN